MEFEVRGRKFTCKEWTVEDLIKFYEMQTKFEELGAGSIQSSLSMTGMNQVKVLELTMQFVAENIDGLKLEELRKWPYKQLGEVMNQILVLNTAINPKAGAAAALSQS